MSADDKAPRRRGLGMGLSALLGPASESYGVETARSGSQAVPIELLRPSPLQPRRHFDEAELEALADSIRMLNEAAPSERVLQLKAFESFVKAADGKATKIIIPSEIQGVAGLATSLKELVKD